jgi:hypothetical protein
MRHSHPPGQVDGTRALGELPLAAHLPLTFVGEALESSGAT